MFGGSGLVLVLLTVSLLALPAGAFAQPAKGPLPSPAQTATGSAGSTDRPQPMDYSRASNWLNVPEIVHDVDVFFLYPTAWARKDPASPVVCAVDLPMMRTSAKAAFARQATAFEPVANVFAPFYRQADAAYTLSLPAAERGAVIGGVPLADAEAAFGYYLEHCNQGRPFILAGHSHGSNCLLFLLSGYLKDHPEAYGRMVAAYVIGYSVTGDYLEANPHLKFAEGRDDTGAIVSFNTQSPAVTAGANPVLLDGALAINPITWTRDGTLATTAEGLGSYMPDAKGVFGKGPQYADARVDPARGVVLCSTADDGKLALGMGPGIYHSYEYAFYYFNLRQNAADRARRYLQARP